MFHGDDRGLILPPKIAFSKIVIIPILFKDTQEKVLKKAKEVFKKLGKHNPILDDRDYSPGWKFSEWELKGIPIRIELGPKDLKKNQVILVRRDTNSKESVKISSLNKKIESSLKEIQENLFKKAEK